MKKLLFTLIGILQVVLVMAQTPASQHTNKVLAPSMNMQESKLNIATSFLEDKAAQVWLLMHGSFDAYRVLGREPQPPKGKDVPMQENSHQEK